MQILPRRSLINIPPEGIDVVVDNAASPQEPASFRWHSRQNIHHRVTPSESKQEGDHWSAVPPPLVTFEDAMAPFIAGSFLGTDDVVHEMDCCSTSKSDTLRAPVRQVSDKGLVNHNTLSESQFLAQKLTEKMLDAATRCPSSSMPRLISFSHNLRTKLQQESLQRTTDFVARKSNDLIQKLSPSPEHLTTTDLIQRAIDEVNMI